MEHKSTIQGEILLAISNWPRAVLINRINDKFRDKKSLLKLPLSEKVSGVLACSRLVGTIDKVGGRKGLPLVARSRQVMFSIS